jgi:hypothetical protein
VTEPRVAPEGKANVDKDGPKEGKKSGKWLRWVLTEAPAGKRVSGEFVSCSGYRIFKVRNADTLVNRQRKAIARTERLHEYP